MASLEVPLANPIGSPRQVPSSFYYKIPVRPIYKSYPVYAPGHEPPRYIEWLKQQTPEILLDDKDHAPLLKTKSDWIAAGKTVFHSPIGYGGLFGGDPSDVLYLRDPKFYKDTKTPIYSLKPPRSPHKFDAPASRGKQVFERERCGRCHTPPLYTNNRLTPVDGFTPSPVAAELYEITLNSIHTDPGLALKTRRGTGYYKVSSLKGVWYRSMFGHSGWCATLEDWFNPRRIRDDYIPTGFKPYGARSYAVKGHPFGLDLSKEDRAALIAFLRTL